MFGPTFDFKNSQYCNCNLKIKIIKNVANLLISIFLHEKKIASYFSKSCVETLKWSVIYTRRKLVQFNLGHRDSWVGKCINKSIWLAPRRYPWCTHGRCPPVANQIDLFMHFLGASRDGLVARRVDLDTISSSDCCRVVILFPNPRTSPHVHNGYGLWTRDFALLLGI